MKIWKQLAAYAREAVKFISTRWIALERGVRIPLAAILAITLAFGVVSVTVDGGPALLPFHPVACGSTVSVQAALAVAKANAAAAVVIKVPGKSKTPVKKPAPVPPPTPPPANGCPTGNLSQRQLEELWVYAGGNPKYELIASAIAEAESSGYEYAADYDSNGSVDRGYWQINSIWGVMSSFNPLENAKAAIYISDDGTDWWPWVTYQTGAYLRYM